MNCPKCNSPGVKGRVQYTDPLTQGWTCECGERWSGPYSEPEKRPKKSKKPVSEELTDLEKEVLARRKLPVLATLMGLRWEPLSEPCPKCGKNALQRGSNMMSGPYGGIVKCDCGHRESAYAFLGRTMIKVEPLPADKEKP